MEMAYHVGKPTDLSGDEQADVLRTPFCFLTGGNASLYHPSDGHYTEHEQQRRLVKEGESRLVCSFF